MSDNTTTVDLSVDDIEYIEQPTDRTILTIKNKNVSHNNIIITGVASVIVRYFHHDEWLFSMRFSLTRRNELIYVWQWTTVSDMMEKSAFDLIRHTIPDDKLMKMVK